MSDKTKRAKTCRTLDIECDDYNSYIYYRTSQGGVDTTEPICTLDNSMAQMVLNLLEDLGHDLRYFGAENGE